MKTDEFLAHEHLRMDVYRLLADCFHLPDENLKQNWVRLSSTIDMFCEEAAKYALVKKKDLDGMDDLESLKIDYARLFVGPYTLAAPPYGSVYLEGKRLVMGNSTVDAQKRYCNAGLNIAEEFKEAPDHIAVELEFMYFLIFKEIEAAGHSNMEAFDNYLREQQAFLEIHLGDWQSEFTEKVIANSATEFYKALAKTTNIFIKQDLLLLQKYNESGGLKENSQVLANP
ncbi:MAG: molecular chaperone TorD family protein [Desulfobacterales bacterium]|jgi:TorA maturation chaperone TorD